MPEGVFEMKKFVMIAVTFAVAFVLPARSEATLILTPATYDCANDNTAASSEEPDVEACAAGLYDPNPDLTLLYKNDAGGGDSGSFASSYQTTISTNGTDATAQDALIEYLSGLSITCPICFLAIKDGGVASPNYLIFDISNWNGIEDILLQGFYPGNGSISHVSIWGDLSGGGGGAPSTLIPEPASLLLLGTGLSVMAAKVRNRRKQAAV
jgi:hypothetical protein